MRYRALLSFNLIVCVLLINVAAMAQHKNTFVPNKNLLHIIDRNFYDAANQYKVLLKRLPPAEFPKTYQPATDKAENIERSDSG